nr:hypothetical protein [Tanacetum cinerariifolium]
MSNINNNKQTQTSNLLHNAIMEAGSKDCPPMLTPGNYIQWKLRIKRYIDTKPNRELIHFCLMNPPCELGWKDKFVVDAEGNPTTTTQQPEWQRFVTLVKQSQELKHVSYHKLYDILKQHQHEVNEIRAEKIAQVTNPLALVAQQQQVYHPTHFNQNSLTRTHQAATRHQEKAEKEIDKLMALISLSFKKIYKPTNNNLRTSSNTSRANQDNSPRIHINAGYESQRSGTVVGARDTVGSSMVQKSGIQCYNC